MDIYYASFLYQGRLLRPASHERLLQSPIVARDPSVLQRFLTDLNDEHGWRILHAPGQCLNVGSLDPVLEQHEIDAGAVDRAEVEAMLARRPKALKEWESVSDEDKALLEQLVVAAAAPNEGNKAPGTYICQAMWSTIDPEYVNTLRVTHNIRVV